jgi:hypothetical protein
MMNAAGGRSFWERKLLDCTKALEAKSTADQKSQKSQAERRLRPDGSDKVASSESARSRRSERWRRVLEGEWKSGDEGTSALSSTPVTPRSSLPRSRHAGSTVQMDLEVMAAAERAAEAYLPMAATRSRRKPSRPTNNFLSTTVFPLSDSMRQPYLWQAQIFRAPTYTAR